MLDLLIALGVFLVASLLVIVRALATDEVRGRVQRQVRSSVEATIESLPMELQEEWADEWRAELEAVISMPLSAATFARGLRKTAGQLVDQPVLEAEVAAAGERQEVFRFRFRSVVYRVPVKRSRPRRRLRYANLWTTIRGVAGDVSRDVLGLPPSHARRMLQLLIGTVSAVGSLGAVIAASMQNQISILIGASVGLLAAIGIALRSR